MPSMRPHPLNPRPPAVPVTPAAPAAAGAAEPTPRTATVAPAPAIPPTDAAVDVAQDEARAGGFHESSYELNHGLHVSESEWPDDVTMPGALGER
jgi:hypothetical protein